MGRTVASEIKVYFSNTWDCDWLIDWLIDWFNDLNEEEHLFPPFYFLVCNHLHNVLRNYIKVYYLVYINCMLVKSGAPLQPVWKIGLVPWEVINELTHQPSL